MKNYPGVARYVEFDARVYVKIFGGGLGIWTPIISSYII